MFVLAFVIAIGHSFPCAHLRSAHSSVKSVTSLSDQCIRTFPLIRLPFDVTSNLYTLSVRGTFSLVKHKMSPTNPEPTMEDVMKAIDKLSSDVKDVKDGMKSMQVELNDVKGSVNDVKGSLAIGTLSSDLTFIKNFTAELNDSLNDMKGSLGVMNERLLRPEIAKMFGVDFAKQYTINGLQSLVQLIYSGIEFPKHYAEPSDIVAGANALARFLDDKRVGWDMLSTFFHCLQSVKEEGDDFEKTLYKFKVAVNEKYSQDPNADDDFKMLDAIKDSFSVLRMDPRHDRNKVTILREKLDRLCKYLTWDDKNKIRHLIDSKSAGVMLLQWHAHHKAVNDGTIWMLLPPLEICMDVKGSISVVGASALINVGEIQTKLSTSKTKAQSQITLRAKVLKWALETLHPSLVDITLAGHIFVTKAEDASQRDSFMDSDISIFVHVM